MPSGVRPDSCRGPHCALAPSSVPTTLAWPDPQAAWSAVAKSGANFSWNQFCLTNHQQRGPDILSIGGTTKDIWVITIPPGYMDEIYIYIYIWLVEQTRSITADITNLVTGI